MESEIKRTQRDYSLAFKLSLVDQVEKGELSYKQAQRRYASKADQRFWCGCANTVDKIGAEIVPAVGKEPEWKTIPPYC